MDYFCSPVLKNQQVLFKYCYIHLYPQLLGMFLWVCSLWKKDLVITRYYAGVLFLLPTLISYSTPSQIASQFTHELCSCRNSGGRKQRTTTCSITKVQSLNSIYFSASLAGFYIPVIKVKISMQATN